MVRYGSIEFSSHAAAEKVLQSYNCTMMPNTEQAFRLNCASFSTGERRADTGSDISIFVGNLTPDVTDTLLHETFASRYQSVKGAKVVVDANTLRSKGYGFVRFGDETERKRAMTEMNGVHCSSRPMRIGVATPKKPSTQQQCPQQQYSSQAAVLVRGKSFGAVLSDGDSANTTIFVGALDSDVTDEELRHYFSQYGEVVSVKIPVGEGCGFVQFATRSSAEDAIQNLNRSVIGNQNVCLSWGRSPANRQRSDSNGNYCGKHGYGSPQNQDPGMYAAAC